MWRRGVLLGALALTGCGFRPLYGPDGERRAPELAGEPSLLQEMAAVRVARIPERNGQLLRRHLQNRLEDRAPGTLARYELLANLAARTEVLGFRRDGSISRVRAIATVTWVLTDGGTPPTVIDRGQVRTLDAYNIPDLQFFAADTSRDDMDSRIITELGDQVVLGVAAALRRRLAAG
ncbi:MAG: LPS assembly lipoprotein LptE [Rubritepida sp.]|nr:LPS assembly lipoprotein LptE [Rubritepida sp.]MCU0946093.1 LPS assembly lipoprotein LptE [Rubritepida sp.]